MNIKEYEEEKKFVDKLNSIIIQILGVIPIFIGLEMFLSGEIWGIFFIILGVIIMSFPLLINKKENITKTN